MRVDEESGDRLVLRDTQLDKKLGISVLVVFLLVIAFLFADGGDWIVASIPVALAAGAVIYLKLTLQSAVVTFDRATDRVTLSVTGRKGSEEWDWKLSDLEGAEVSEIRGSGGFSGKRSQTTGDRIKRRHTGADPSLSFGRRAILGRNHRNPSVCRPGKDGRPARRLDIRRLKSTWHLPGFHQREPPFRSSWTLLGTYGALSEH